MTDLVLSPAELLAEHGHPLYPTPAPRDDVLTYGQLLRVQLAIEAHAERLRSESAAETRAAEYDEIADVVHRAATRALGAFYRRPAGGNRMDQPVRFVID